MAEKTYRSQVCIVTDEIKPFTKGGIGVFVRNLVKTYKNQCELTILYTGSIKIDTFLWNSEYPEIAFIELDTTFSDISNKFQAEMGYHLHHFSEKSLKILISLMSLSSESRRFDFVEFLDWGAPGFHAIQAKRCGIWKTNAKLVVRIHCPESVLRRFETRSPNFIHNIIYDMERKCISDADLVVASIESVQNSISEHFRLPSSWHDKVRVEAPPVYIDCDNSKDELKTSQRNILFSSKIQEVKRPDLFVEAGVDFIINNTNYDGNIIFVAMPVDTQLFDAIKTKIPAILSRRIIFEMDLSSSDRARLISNSIVVFPNFFEAFCFAAYEASLSGAIVVLNGQNPAFDNSSPWRDGINCFKFDGSSVGLSRALKRAVLIDSNIKPVSLRHPDKPYWSTFDAKSEPAEIANIDHSRYTLTVFVLHKDQPEALELTLRSIKQEIINIKIVIIDNASEQHDTILFIDSLDQTSANNLEVHKYKFEVSWSIILNQERIACHTDYCCVVPAGTTFTIGALGAFVSALAQQPAFDIILPASAVYNNNVKRSLRYVFHPLGEALASAAIKNYYAAHFFLFRTQLMEMYEFPETIRKNFEWPYLRKLALHGHRMLNWSLVDVFYNDTTISDFEAYTEIDFALLTDVVSKIGSYHIQHGLLIDLVSCSSVPNSLKDTNSRDESLSDSSLMEELELRRRAARESNNKRNTPLLNLLKKITTKRIFRHHVDLVSPSREVGNIATVSSGSNVLITGWAFCLEQDNILCPSIILFQKGSRLHSTRSENIYRLDVALNFKISERYVTGFADMFDLRTFVPGNISIMAEYKFADGQIHTVEIMTLLCR